MVDGSSPGLNNNPCWDRRSAGRSADMVVIKAGDESRSRPGASRVVG
jgi:hypothetical protein